MTSEYVDAKIKERNEETVRLVHEIANSLKELYDDYSKIEDENFRYYTILLKFYIAKFENCVEITSDIQSHIRNLWVCDIINIMKSYVRHELDFPNILLNINNQLEDLYYRTIEGIDDFYNSLRDQKIYLSGDIVITDPCYLTGGLTRENEEKEIFYKELFVNEGHKGIANSTIYGDWSCHVFDMNTNEPVGQFCADGAEVCVATLDDIMKLNPKCDILEYGDWCFAVIKDFEGDVEIKIKQDKTDKFDDYICFVEGHGVNKITGEPIDFISSQTGF